jgi:molecular chaperone GrpE
VGPDTDDTTERDAVTELEGQLLRALADLDNLRRRYARELARERGDERARVAAAWLPVVDAIDRALGHVEADPKALEAGIEAIRGQALAVLERLGYPRYEDVGARFDPGRHEAVTTMPSDAPEGTVVAVVRPGYGTAEQPLRPAGVVVARATG